jgi:hypothetical protein
MVAGANILVRELDQIAARQRHVPGDDGGAALVEVPDGILFVVGVFRRHAVDRHRSGTPESTGQFHPRKARTVEGAGEGVRYPSSNDDAAWPGNSEVWKMSKSAVRGCPRLGPFMLDEQTSVSTAGS